MEQELINYPLRIDRKLHKRLKDFCYQNETEMRAVILQLIEDLLAKDSGSLLNSFAPAVKAEKEFAELVKHFFTYGNSGQVALFKMALDAHKKNMKKAAGA